MSRSVKEIQIDLEYTNKKLQFCLKVYDRLKDVNRVTLKDKRNFKDVKEGMEKYSNMYGNLITELEQALKAEMN